MEHTGFCNTQLTFLCNTTSYPCWGSSASSDWQAPVREIWGNDQEGEARFFAIWRVCSWAGRSSQCEAHCGRGGLGAVAVAGVDIINCFGMFEWPTTLDAVGERSPELEPWLRWCITEPDHVRSPCGDWVTSNRGARQGEPEGPLEAALTIGQAVPKAQEPGGGLSTMGSWWYTPRKWTAFFGRWIDDWRLLGASRGSKALGHKVKSSVKACIPEGEVVFSFFDFPCFFWLIFFLFSPFFLAFLFIFVFLICFFFMRFCSFLFFLIISYSGRSKVTRVTVGRDTGGGTNQPTKVFEFVKKICTSKNLNSGHESTRKSTSTSTGTSKGKKKGKKGKEVKQVKHVKNVTSF